MPTAYIAIGSNHRPAEQIARALDALAAAPDWLLQTISPIYRSRAVDKTNNPTDEASYLNAVVAIETDLHATEIRRRLRAIESELGRDRRTPARVAIDLDLVALDAQVLDVDNHHLPDPAIVRHAFVAVPFADIAPDWVHPECGKPISEIAAPNRHTAQLEIVSE